MTVIITVCHWEICDDGQWHRHREHIMAPAGFGYCAQAAQAFVEEATVNGADVRYSETVHDIRLEHSENEPSRVTGVMTI